MKKYFIMMVALLLAVAIAAPVFAEVKIKYGGEFRVRYNTSNNMYDATDSGYWDFAQLNADPTWRRGDDHDNWIDQRLRLYVEFIGSENLKVVTKFEMGDSVWGQFGNGGRVGADERIVELKNAYLQFNIPCTPTTAVIGIQTVTLLNSWIVDDDVAAALLVTKLDPISVIVGYVGGQNNSTNQMTLFPALNTRSVFSNDEERVDDFVLALNYAAGPFSAQLVGFYQMAHGVPASINPEYTIVTPLPMHVPANFGIDDNDLFDLGINLTYKTDWLKAYVNFVKNLGSVDFIGGGGADYKGWMADAGLTYFAAPFSFNIGGFYTTGQDLDDDTDDIDAFTYPLATAKYFSEIVGGGILDKQQIGNQYWRGYQFPSNIWTITAGASWQVLEGTKLSLSYWYFSTSEDVPKLQGDGDYKMVNELGHEIDLYVSQNIVDGLKLDLVGAYMFAGDAYNSDSRDTDNIYELGAKLSWSF